MDIFKSRLIDLLIQLHELEPDQKEISDDDFLSTLEYIIQDRQFLEKKIEEIDNWLKEKKRIIEYAEIGSLNIN